MGQRKATDSTTDNAASPEASSGSVYTVLARRYRSRDFDELVGQEPIARTLRNAVTSGRAAHAYLFCGSRGVGKTSMARILARALNVSGDLEQADEIAEAIFRGDDLDVIEIDGASNRGIDDARDLIAAAVLTPARCRFKIYIIDEVHMLTREAFNALLKTMEEPPSHVKFILCTTEPHKVPATIQSRCQRFDFRLLSTAEIAGQLRRILESENAGADEQVVAQVARLGRGSMRDALSLLDRLLAAGEKKVTVELMEETLGLPDHALAVGLTDAIADGDTPNALQAASALLDRGATEERALEMLTEHFGNLLLVATCGADCELVELSDEGRKVAAEQARKFDSAGLVHMIAVCDSVSRRLRESAAARALYDAVIVRLCLSEKLADIAGLLAGEGSSGGPGPAPSKKKEEAVTIGSPSQVVEPKTAVEPGSKRGESLWARVRAFAAESPSDHAKLEHLIYRSFDGHRLQLAIDAPDAGLARWLITQGDALAEIVRRATDHRVVVDIDASSVKAAPEPQEKKKRIEEAQRLPVVRRACEIFDATVVDVRDAGSEEHV
jgi:DNA polymerase-3 subunit gamma/tau